MQRSPVGILGALVWSLTWPTAAYAIKPPSSSRAIVPEAKIEVYFIGPKLLLGDAEAAPRRFAQRIRIQEGQATGAMNYEGGNPRKGTPPDLEMGGKIKVQKVAPAIYPVRIIVDITFESLHEKRRERYQQELDILNPLDLVYLKNQNGVGSALLRWEELKNPADDSSRNSDQDLLKLNIRAACLCPFEPKEENGFYLNYAGDEKSTPMNNWLNLGTLKCDGLRQTSVVRKPVRDADGNDKDEWLASLAAKSSSKKLPAAVDVKVKISGPEFETLIFHDTIIVERIPASFMLQNTKRGYLAIVEVLPPAK